ncbi:Hypothetical predicted protein [Olea europaea subsp. europaea]|uniref:Uncharacterized protein n=1 Tax=Olea europaea subsp. europaea TaxID=158383 RepID=A0A8S0SER0_OLEEU|nr:Hypothetical predicted protein [Olea europaea subsp. europaea]
MEWLVEDLENCRRVALDENRKYVEAMKNINEITKEAAKERKALKEMQGKYEKLLSENEENVEKSQVTLEHLNKLLAQTKVQHEGQAHSSEKSSEVLILQEDVEKLRIINKDLEENYNKWQSQMNEKIELLTTEKEQLDVQLKVTQEELQTLMQDYKQVVSSGNSSNKAQVSEAAGTSAANNESTNTNSRIDPALALKVQKTKEEYEIYKIKAQREIDEIHKAREAMEMANKALKMEVEQLKTSLGTKASTPDAAYQEFGVVMNKICERLEAVVEGGDGNKAGNKLVQRLEGASNKLEGLKGNLNGYEKLVGTIDELSERLEKALKNNSNQEQGARLAKRLEDATNRIKTFEEIVNDMSVERDKLTGENNSLKAEIKALKEKSKNIGAELKGQKALKDANSAEYEQKIKQMESRLEELAKVKEELTKVKGELKNAKQKNQELENEVKIKSQAGKSSVTSANQQEGKINPLNAVKFIKGFD